MFPGLARVRRKRTAVLDAPGRRVRPMACPVGRHTRSVPPVPSGGIPGPVPPVPSGGIPGPVPRPPPGGRLPAEAIPGRFVSPAPSSPRTLCTPGKRTAGPRTGKRTAGPQTAKRTAGPRTIQSGGQRCDPAGPPPAPELQGVHAGLSGSGPTRADNALLWESLATVLPVGGCRRGSAP
jgi:hypothetical protein